MWHGFRAPRSESRARPWRPQLEALEDRDCPAAPTLGITVTMLTGQAVRITGQVMDEQPGSAVVTLGGVVSGTVTPNQYGMFSVDREASALGTVTAVALDAEGLSSNTATGTVWSNNPVITLFSIGYAGRKNVILSGHVNDETPAGRTVTFTGKAGGTTTTDANGDFSLTVEASGLGDIHAQATDPWGLTSAIKTVTAQSSEPVITSFSARRAVGNIWVFEGYVQDEDPQGLVVRLGGLASLEGKTATVDANGHFFLVVELAQGEAGIATAQTTDWWGLDSEIAEYLVAPT